SDARQRAYSALGQIDWPGGFFRSDIGELTPFEPASAEAGNGAPFSKAVRQG
ncbi:MAG: hypothetical protein GXP01_07390, partial [Alphaproteobacteria bacterium]|nr:hypothetical protein [Alphaproteobacteria bacterium]